MQTTRRVTGTVDNVDLLLNGMLQLMQISNLLIHFVVFSERSVVNAPLLRSLFRLSVCLSVCLYVLVVRKQCILSRIYTMSPEKPEIRLVLRLEPILTVKLYSKRMVLENNSFNSVACKIIL